MTSFSSTYVYLTSFFLWNQPYCCINNYLVWKVWKFILIVQEIFDKQNQIRNSMIIKKIFENKWNNKSIKTLPIKLPCKQSFWEKKPEINYVRHWYFWQEFWPFFSYFTYFDENTCRCPSKKCHSEALLGILLRGVRMLGITHRGIKMPNIQLKISIFTSFMIFSKILGGSIDPPDPPLTGPLLQYVDCHLVVKIWRCLWDDDDYKD